MSTSINKLLNAALNETLLNEEDDMYSTNSKEKDHPFMLDPRDMNQREDHPFMPSNSDVKQNNLPSGDLPRVFPENPEDPSYIDRLKDFYANHKPELAIGGTALAAGLGALALAKKLRNKKVAAANKKSK